MDPPPHDTAALFEEASSWDAYRGNPYLEQRTGIVRALLPPGVGTLLDVGCGNGILVTALADRCETFGLDPSARALRAFAGRRVAGLAQKLPLRSGAVDLITCLEVLEHLPDGAVEEAAAELARVARRWILLGAPDRENPLRNALRCDCCGAIFNRSHHLQSFDERRLRSLFPGFVSRAVRRGGQPVRPVPALLIWARHRIARRFYKGPGETRGLCPRCGNRSFPPFRPNPGSLAIDGINRLLSRRRPYWILLLLERGERGR